MPERLLAIKLFLVKLVRELRNKEVQIFLFALALGTTAITAPSLLAERLSSGVKSYSEDVLGGDARLSTPLELDEKWIERGEELGLRSSRSLFFPSIVVNPDNANFQLARIRVVDDNYPLKGNLIAVSELAAVDVGQGDKRDSDEVTNEHLSPPPPQGEIWLEEFLALLLGVEIGEKVSLGETQLTFTKYLLEEPGRASFFSFAPRAMLNFADLEATRLILPGSRLRYNYLWAGDEDREELNLFLDELEPRLEVNQRLIRADDKDSGFTDVLRRLRAFLMLSGSLCIFLSAFALLLSVRHFIDRNRRYVALLKTIGYSPGQSLLYLWKRITPAALLAYILGCCGGWLGYKVTAFYLAPVLPPPDNSLLWLPFAVSAASAVICLLTFALPGLWRLAYATPLALLRPSTDKFGMQQLLTTLIACVGIFTLLLFYSNDLVVSSGLFGTVIALILVMGLVGYGIMKLLHDHVANKQIAVPLKLALVSLFRYWPINSFQILSFAAAFMLIGILSIMRVSFINDWQDNIDPTTPNYFLVNIGPDKLQPVRDLLTENQVEEGVFAGMVRGKLIRVDGEGLAERTKRLGTHSDEAEREFNLGWSDDLPEHNQLIEGQWWSEAQATAALVANADGGASAGLDLGIDDDAWEDAYPLSIEEEIATDFGIEIGTKLEFVVGGRTIYGVASNLRRVDWSDFNPNFYVLFPDGALENFPRTYMTSFYLPQDKKELLLELVREFPTFSIISVERILVQLQEILDLVSNAMQLILLLSLLAALAVFVAAVQVSIELRARTTATLRLIGETARQAFVHNLLEFCFIGLLAGILAVLGSEIVVWAVYEHLLDQRFVPHYYFWILCPIFSTLLAGLVGALWSRKVINIPPRDTLRTLGV